MASVNWLGTPYNPIPSLDNTSVPLGKVALSLRGTRYVSRVEKSTQRGIVTAQSHLLYAVAQSAHVAANEY